MNYHELLQCGKEILKRAGKEEVDAGHLLFFLRKWTITDYLKYGKDVVSEVEEREFYRLIQERVTGVPVQEIIGSQNFYGYDIIVSSDVLTPRPETEMLVELALKEMERRERPQVLDLCTGSGCIAIALVKENPNVELVAIDVSEKALHLAERNAEANLANDRIVWIKSDLFTKLTNECFDIIISNPPYIPTAEIEDLETEVKNYDPHLALDGGKDGLLFYRKIAEQARRYLKDDGTLLVEIGDGQGEAVADLLRQNDWHEVRIFPDYSGRQRMVTAAKEKRK